jgi:hypothetical protein
MNDETPLVGSLARQLIIEYGESAPSMAQNYIERCRSEGDLDWARSWETVKRVLLRLQPGGVSSFKS